MARSRTREERLQLGAGVGAAVEAPPRGAQPPHELVAGVDRHEVALGSAIAALGVDQERLHVRCHRGQLGVVAGHVGPGVEGQQGLRGAGRARVERDHGRQARVDEEERDAHRDLERVPLRRRELQVGEREVAVGHRPEPALAADEQQVAPAARAPQGPALHVDEVVVLVADRLRAQLAPLAHHRRGRRRAATDAGQDGERARTASRTRRAVGASVIRPPRRPRSGTGRSRVCVQGDRDAAGPGTPAGTTTGSCARRR